MNKNQTSIISFRGLGPLWMERQIWVLKAYYLFEACHYYVCVCEQLPYPINVHLLQFFEMICLVPIGCTPRGPPYSSSCSQWKWRRFSESIANHCPLGTPTFIFTRRKITFEKKKTIRHHNPRIMSYRAVSDSFLSQRLISPAGRRHPLGSIARPGRAPGYRVNALCARNAINPYFAFAWGLLPPIVWPYRLSKRQGPSFPISRSRRRRRKCWRRRSCNAIPLVFRRERPSQAVITSIQPHRCLTYDNTWPVAMRFMSIRATQIKDPGAGPVGFRPRSRCPEQERR